MKTIIYLYRRLDSIGGANRTDINYGTAQLAIDEATTQLNAGQGRVYGFYVQHRCLSDDELLTLYNRFTTSIDWVGGAAVVTLDEPTVPMAIVGAATFESAINSLKEERTTLTAALAVMEADRDAKLAQAEELTSQLAEMASQLLPALAELLIQHSPGVVLRRPRIRVDLALRG